jgi:cation transport regulator ChaB
MPYSSLKELPAWVKKLPKHAQEIYRSAFNAAYKKYGESRAHAIAAAAVKKYKHKDGESVSFEEHLVLDGGHWRETSEGYLVATPRVARTGIQTYQGWEMGIDDDVEVKVYRPEETVFDSKSMHSFGHKTITLGHPEGMVDAKNWKKLAVGLTGEEVARDGEFIRVPMVLMDAATIETVKRGQRELSVGYTSDLDWDAGETADGEVYDAVQRNIRANHIAIVAQARGGPKLRVGDEGGSGMERERFSTRTITLDGVDFTLPDPDASVILRTYDRAVDEAKKLKDDIGKLTKSLTDSAASIDGLKKQIETKDGEIAALKKQVEDGKLTPAMLDKLTAERVEVVSKAVAILGDKLDPKGKTPAEIKRAVVQAKLGDEATKSMSDAGIDGAFAALTVEAKLSGADGINQAFQRPGFLHQRDSDETVGLWDKRNAEIRDAWKGTTQ